MAKKKDNCEECGGEFGEDDICKDCGCVKEDDSVKKEATTEEDDSEDESSEDKEEEEF
ncbi:MAG: hypothetical protein V1678_01945 [Candidatus Aenigmatarchaeota archaeon]